ncbi:MAG: hypothetical protein PGN13_10185 [Patulibacter minatonensis]
MLAGLPPAAQGLPWHIAWLEPIGFEDPGVDLSRFYADDPETDGWPTSWAELTHLAANTVQIPDGLILAPHPGAEPPRFANEDEAILAGSAAALAAFDSTFWNLWVPDDWVPHLEARFIDLRPAIPGKQPLTT